jgi:hypothetical protein
LPFLMPRSVAVKGGRDCSALDDGTRRGAYHRYGYCGTYRFGPDFRTPIRARDCSVASEAGQASDPTCGAMYSDRLCLRSRGVHRRDNAVHSVGTGDAAPADLESRSSSIYPALVDLREEDPPNRHAGTATNTRGTMGNTRCRSFNTNRLTPIPAVPSALCARQRSWEWMRSRTRSHGMPHHS